MLELEVHTALHSLLHRASIARTPNPKIWGKIRFWWMQFSQELFPARGKMIIHFLKWINFYTTYHAETDFDTLFQVHSTHIPQNVLLMGYHSVWLLATPEKKPQLHGLRQEGSVWLWVPLIIPGGGRKEGFSFMKMPGKRKSHLAQQLGSTFIVCFSKIYNLSTLIRQP